MTKRARVKLAPLSAFILLSVLPVCARIKLRGSAGYGRGSVEHAVDVIRGAGSLRALAGVNSDPLRGRGGILLVDAQVEQVDRRVASELVLVQGKSHIVGAASSVVEPDGVPLSLQQVAAKVSRRVVGD